MSLIKFITVFDDEKQMLFSESILRRYNISAYPTMFFSDNKPFFDGINTDSERFSEIKLHNPFILPHIPAEVFQNAYLQAYNDGYFSVAVICPHGKWYPYYKDAVIAANRVRRSTKLDFSSFRIDVIDSKAFAAGAMFHALTMARQHNINHCPSGIVVNHGRKNAATNRNFILTKNASKLCPEQNQLNAFKSFGYRFEKIPFTQVHDSIVFDKFAQTVYKYIKKGSGRYSVSIGAKCDFAGNIIGRIQEISGIEPICCMQYAVASADILGDSSICINLFK